MTKQRWLGIGLGVTVFLIAFGLALAQQLFQVSREVPADLEVFETAVLPDAQLRLEFVNGSPVDFLDFRKPDIRQEDGARTRSIFVTNATEPAIGLTLTDPCHPAIDSNTGQEIGFFFADLFSGWRWSSVEGEWRVPDGRDEDHAGHTCDDQRPAQWRLLPGQTYRMEIGLKLQSEFEDGPGDYDLNPVVIGGVGREVPAPVPIQPPGGMVGWWPADGNAEDIVGGNDGTLTGDFVEGMVQQGFAFDGSGDHVLVPDNNGDLNITGDVNVDLWAKRTVFDENFHVMISKSGVGEQGNGGDVFDMWFHRNNVVAAAYNTNESYDMVVGPVVEDSDFHHYAYVRSGDRHILFMDGEVVASGDLTAEIADTSGVPMTIGAFSLFDVPGLCCHFGGVIDEVEVFDRALSADEIRAIYRAGSAGKFKPIQPPAGMVSWWPGDGNANDIVDGNHGTLSGDATFAAGMVDEGFSLDGTGDFVLVPDNPRLNITGDVTVDLWAKRTVFGRTSVLVDKGANLVGTADRPDAYTMWFSQGDHLVAGFARADGSLVFLVGPVVTDSRFHHYAYVRSGNTHNLFMDGTVVANDSFIGVPGDTSGLPLAIGAVRRDPNPPGFAFEFGGVIDEVELFDRALSAEEIRAIYAAGSAGKIKPEPIPPPAGMVSWWPGDGNAHDIVDGNNGTLVGGAGFAPGMVGEAFSLDGIDDYIAVTNAVDFAQSDYSIDGWFKTSTGGQEQDIFSAAKAGTALFGLLVEVGGDGGLRYLHRPVAGQSGGTNITTDFLVNDGVFHHFAAVKNGPMMKLYVDGSVAGTGSDPNDITFALDILIGRLLQSVEGGAGRFFQGIIDEVELFNRALTAEEIRAIYEAGSAGKIKPEPPPPPEPIPPPAGMMSWWSFNEGAGEIAHDIWGSSDGLLMNGPIWTGGVVDGALSFDGVDDYVAIPDSQNLDITDEITIEAWIHPATPINGYVLSKQEDTGPSGAYSIGISDDTDRIDFRFNGTNFRSSFTLFNRWSHIAFTYSSSAGEVKNYINGVLVDTYSHTGPISITDDPLQIGRRLPNNFFFNGLIDEVSIFNRALSEDEIRAIYEAGSAGKIKPPPPEPIPPPAGIVSWWPGDGNANDVIDGNPGALQGGATFATGMVGDAFSFDSNDDRVTIDHNPNLNVPPTGFTVDFWMRGSPSQPDSHFLVVDKSHGWVDSTGWVFQGISSNGNLFFGIGAGGAGITNFRGVESLASVLDNQFHHVAGTWDGGTIRLYLDSVLQGTAALDVPANNTRPVNIAFSWGGGPPRRFFRGSVDEVGLFSRALTAEEIRAIYQAGSAGKIKPMARIAFASTGDGDWEIYVMNADGTGQTRLTVNTADDYSPAWSPDGSMIAFVSGRDGNLDIYVMNADGSGQTPLTNNSVHDENTPPGPPTAAR